MKRTWTNIKRHNKLSNGRAVRDHVFYASQRAYEIIDFSIKAGSIEFWICSEYVKWQLGSELYNKRLFSLHILRMKISWCIRNVKIICKIRHCLKKSSFHIFDGRWYSYIALIKKIYLSIISLALYYIYISLYSYFNTLISYVST